MPEMVFNKVPYLWLGCLLITFNILLEKTGGGEPELVYAL